jgi:hypothetical protein
MFGVEVGGLGETTSTLSPSTSDPLTSTTVGADVSAVEESTTPSGGNVATTEGVDIEDLVVDTLPFTGANGYLVIPGVLLMFVGVMAVLLTGGLGVQAKGRHESS